MEIQTLIILPSGNFHSSRKNRTYTQINIINSNISNYIKLKKPRKYTVKYLAKIAVGGDVGYYPKKAAAVSRSCLGTIRGGEE